MDTDQFARIRIGIDRPSHSGYDIADYVLSNLPNHEFEKIDEADQDEETPGLRKLVSGFSNLDNLVRNKNPTIESMSSDLLDLGNGSFLEVQLSRLDFLENNNEWVSLPSDWA